MKWDEISWVLRGSLKQKVITSLDRPKTATILSKEIKTHRSTISAILIEMNKRGIVLCLDNKQPYNRFYQLTKKGKELKQEVLKSLI